MTITNSLVTKYGQDPYKDGLETWGLWDRRNRPYDGTATPAIVMTPHNYGPDNYYDPASEEMRELADKGFVTACPYPNSPVAGRTFGNTDAIDSVDKCYNYLVSNYGCRSDKVVLLGMSMGGLAVCNWARTNVSKVAAIAMVTPAVDLQMAHDINAGYSTEVDAAFTDHAGFLAAKPTFSPVQFAATLSSIPVRIWYSDNDNMITYSSLTTFASAHGNTTLTSIGAQGHNPSGAQGSDIADWFNSLL